MDAGAPYQVVLGGAPYRMVPGGVSMGRSTDDRTRQGGDDGYGEDAEPKTGDPRCLLSNLSERKAGGKQDASWHSGCRIDARRARNAETSRR
jgi:hypothetical protein